MADLVPLDFNNRVLVSAGLKRIRAGQMQPGVRALFAVAGRDPSRAEARDFGFALGPRINAAGRLEDMRIGIECLTTDDDARALELARTLDAINRERRDLQVDMVAHVGRWWRLSQWSPRSVSACSTRRGTPASWGSSHRD